MRMSELVKIIEDQGKGVRAYIACARLCRDQLKTRSDQSAAYLLLAVAADKFVDTYDDQPLLSQRAEDEFLHFKSYVDRLDEADRSSNADDRLKALNDVAIDVANHKLVRSTV
ncbi:MAG: hypothetical protein NXI27_22715 [Alphaproteobacteria bacterium]|nr:hypothetical protein [Alphaproteobacteria bacterium]